jgi:hypothetical protein
MGDTKFCKPDNYRTSNVKKKNDSTSSSWVFGGYWRGVPASLQRIRCSRLSSQVCMKGRVPPQPHLLAAPKQEKKGIRRRRSKNQYQAFPKEKTEASVGVVLFPAPPVLRVSGARHNVVHHPWRWEETNPPPFSFLTNCQFIFLALGCATLTSVGRLSRAQPPEPHSPLAARQRETGDETSLSGKVEYSERSFFYCILQQLKLAV